MLRIERSTSKLTSIPRATLSDARLEERSGLQELILKNPIAFFEQECNESLLLIKEEVEPSGLVGDRIDLLAIDPEGRAVIIELKRGNHKLQLLQSLTYAAMISDWVQQDFENVLPKSERQNFEQFISEHGIREINEFQRIILIAEAFGFETLQTAKWLVESYGFNITCYQISIARDAETTSEYLSAVQIFPLKELATQARRKGALKSEKATKFQEIEELLPSCTNDEIVSFFQNNLGLRRNRRRDSLVFPQTGKMRFRVRPKGGYARVSQLGRFAGDEAIWQESISSPELKPRATDLRFRLTTTIDADKFMHFVATEMVKVNWTKSLSDEDESLDEE